MKKPTSNAWVAIGIGSLMLVGIGLNNLLAILCAVIGILGAAGAQIVSGPGGISPSPAPRIRAKTPAGAKQYCQVCAKYHEVPAKKARSWRKCPDCSAIMAHVIKCQNCSQQMMISKEYHDQYGGMEIPCRNCGTKMRI